MKSLKGQLLIASPKLLDPNFAQSVVLMVQHDKSGALGLILNRKTEMTLQEGWEQVSQTPCPREGYLYVGGPCEGVLMAIHPYEEAGQMQVLPDLWFSTDTQHIEWLLKQTDEPRIRFFVGYAGWSPGQLENELQIGSWLITPATTERVFAPEDTLWRNIKREVALSAIIGKVNPKIIPADPGLN
jgi:putative transcriptional regulator